MKILAIGDFHGKFSDKLKREAEKADLILSLGDYAGISEWYPFILEQLRRIKKNQERLTAEEYFGESNFQRILKKDNQAGRKILSDLNKYYKKTIFIFGNGDDAFYDYPFGEFFKADKKNKNFLKKIKMKNITYSKTKFEGIQLAGFGGYIDPDSHLDRKSLKKDKQVYLRIHKRQEQSRKKLFKILKSFSKNEGIFVFHYTPKGVFDIIKDKKNPYYGKNVGVGFFTEAIKKYSPKLVLCGHMHEYQDKKFIGKSLVVNPGSAGEGKAAVIDWPSLEVRFIK